MPIDDGHPTRAAADYRRAVQAVVESIGTAGLEGEPVSAVVTRHLRSGLLTPHLQRVDDAVVGSVTEGLDSFTPTAVSSARNATALVRVRLLSLIESEWWSDAEPFATDADVSASSDLIDLRRARRQGLLLFRFRVQTHRRLGRAVRALDRRLLPGRSPATIGMRLPFARPAVVELLNLCAHRLSVVDPWAPPLWVNSCTRSAEYQKALRENGYGAREGSTHCSGWAADVEMSWMVRRGCGDALADVLRTAQAAGEATVIDEGQAWHVCVAPDAATSLTRDWHRHAASIGVG